MTCPRCDGSGHDERYRPLSRHPGYRNKLTWHQRCRLCMGTGERELGGEG